MDLEFVSCQLCGKKNTQKLVFIPPFCYVQCKGCNLVYLNPRPSQSLIDKIYRGDEHYLIDFQKDPTGEKDLYLFRFTERLKDIRRFKKEKGKLLDIGCSWGYFLSHAKEESWDTYGIELSLEQARYAVEKFNLKIFTHRLKKIQFPSRYFDVITLWHVLEHFPQPINELLEIKRILKEDGLLTIEVPSPRRLKDDIGKAKFDFDHPPGHLFYYNVKTLTSLLGKAGFQVIQAKGCGDTGILRKTEDLKMRFIRIFVVRHFRYLKGLKRFFQTLKKILKMQENILVYAKLKAD